MGKITADEFAAAIVEQRKKREEEMKWLDTVEEADSSEEEEEELGEEEIWLAKKKCIVLQCDQSHPCYSVINYLSISSSLFDRLYAHNAQRDPNASPPQDGTEEEEEEGKAGCLSFPLVMTSMKQKEGGRDCWRERGRSELLKTDYC